MSQHFFFFHFISYKNYFSQKTWIPKSITLHIYNIILWWYFFPNDDDGFCVGQEKYLCYGASFYILSALRFFVYSNYRFLYSIQHSTLFKKYIYFWISINAGKWMCWKIYWVSESLPLFNLFLFVYIYIYFWNFIMVDFIDRLEAEFRLRSRLRNLIYFWNLHIIYTF